MKINTFILPVIALTVLFTVGFTLEKEKTEPAYSWLQGRWTGNGFGGFSEEVWSPPGPDGKMMGVYRHFKADSSLNFYEFLVLDEEGMHLKHFKPDLEGWEEKEDFVSFKMISYDKSTIKMKGLTFQKTGADSMEIILRMKNSDGSVKDEIFKMVKR